MNFIVKNLIYFGVIFVFVFLFYILFLNRKYKKNLNKGKFPTEVSYLLKRFDLDLKKTKFNKILWITSIINSFIIAFTSVICINIDKYIVSVLIGFVVLMVLIYSLYEIVGRILKKKEVNKNV